MSRLPALLAFLLTLAPAAAQACYVCMSGREDDVEFAFVATTVLLSVLPLGMIGAAVWWLRRRLREMEEKAPPPQPLAAPEAERAESVG